MKIKNLFVIGGMFLVLSGFSLNYSYEAYDYNGQKITGPVEVSVVDERPFILNGDKKPSYVGHYRSGIGTPMNVYADGNIALAEQLQNDMRKEVKALSVKDASSASAKKLKVAILDYNFDNYMSSRFWYEIKVEVYDQSGKLLAQDSIKIEKQIKGRFMSGSYRKFKREMPTYYSEMIQSLVRNNEKIMHALR